MTKQKMFKLLMKQEKTDARNSAKNIRKVKKDFFYLGSDDKGQVEIKLVFTGQEEAMDLFFSVLGLNGSDLEVIEVRVKRTGNQEDLTSFVKPVKEKKDDNEEEPKASKKKKTNVTLQSFGGDPDNDEN